MKAAFKFELGSDIAPGQVTVGKFDGKHPSLAAATTTGKVVLHSPHQSAKYQEESREIQGAVRHLKINNRVTAVSAACLEPAANTPTDSLVIGTETTLQAYNVEENRDLFFVEVSDGISTIVCGHLAGMDTSESTDGNSRNGRNGRNDRASSSVGSATANGGRSSSSAAPTRPPTIFAGGDLSVHGFDKTGEETFWTVTGGNIGAMALLDVNGDGATELLGK